MTLPPQLLAVTGVDDLEALVLEHAQACGWRGHLYAGGDGLSTVVLVRPPRLVLAALVGGPVLTEEQYVLLQRVADALDGVEVYVWTPRHWPRLIDNELRR